MIHYSNISACLKRAADLADVSDSPRLDIEILLAFILNKNRTYLFTWPEQTLTSEQAATFEKYFRRRKGGEPIAHIIGQREFWSLPLFVNNTTLIPRPDTELLVELVLQIFAEDDSDCSRNLLDLGTGSGAIMLAIASEKKHWQCLGVDKSADAVALAEKNRTHLQLNNARVMCSDWFSAVGKMAFDVIVSNPPYIDASDAHLNSGDLRFEPASALVAENSGLADIELILEQAADYLLPSGWLLIEHGFGQGESVRHIFYERGYSGVVTARDYGGNERVTYGKKANCNDE
jgi:release factor glutamine methyltransferase